MKPKLRFKEFNEDYNKYTFDEIADYKKGPFGSALKKEIFVPKSENSIKVYEQQNAIRKDWTLERYFITKEYYEKLKSFTIKPGDIIVSCAGTIGEYYVLPEDAEIGVINQALMKINTNEKVNQSYFLYIFDNMVYNFSKTFSNGSAIKNIPPFADLKKQIAFIPDIVEQNKVAKTLELLDKKIELQSKKIEDLKLFKKGLILRMKKYNENWKEYKVSELFKITRGVVIPKTDLSDINKEDYKYPVYSSQTSNDGILGFDTKYDFDGEYLTWTTDGANAGKVFYRNGKFRCTNVCGVLYNDNNYYVDELTAELLNYETPKHVSYVGNPKLMNNVMSSIKIYLPDKNESNIVSNILLEINNKIVLETKKADKLVQIKKGLMQSMFV